MFFGGKMKAMSPKLVTDDGRHVVIRPLAYCREKRSRRLGRGAPSSRSFPATCAAASPTCSARRSSRCLREWEKRFPGRVETLFRSLANVVPSHLMDTQLHDFRNLLVANGTPDPGRRHAFDPEEFRSSSHESSWAELSFAMIRG